MKRSYSLSLLSLLLLVSALALFGCDAFGGTPKPNTSSEPAKDTSSEPAKDPEITWNSVSLNGTDCEEYLRLSLDYNSGTITIQSKHKNKYEVFENVGINIQLGETSRAQYWAGFAKITLDSNGYGEFTSDKLKILCAYYGHTLGIQTSQCYIYGTYKYGS